MARVLGGYLIAGALLTGVATATTSPAASSAAAEPMAIEAPVAPPATGFRDAVAMLLVGTALIGLATAVRRAA